MKNLPLSALALAFFVCVGPIDAQETAVTHVFEDGTPAKAEEINQNFQDLATAIDAARQAARGWKIVDSLGQDMGAILSMVPSSFDQAWVAMKSSDGRFFMARVFSDRWDYSFGQAIPNAHYVPNDCTGTPYIPSRDTNQQQSLLDVTEDIALVSIYNPPTDGTSSGIGPPLVGDGVDITLDSVCSFWGSSGTCGTAEEYYASIYGQAAVEIWKGELGVPELCFTEEVFSLIGRGDVSWQRLVPHQVPEYTPPYRAVIE